MLRVAGKRLLCAPWGSSRATSAFLPRSRPLNSESSSSDASSRSVIASDVFCFNSLSNLTRGFASEALTPCHDLGMISGIPATVAAVKNPTSKIVYDEYNHERFPPGDPASALLRILF